MNSLQVRSHMEETMVLLTPSQPESLKKGPEVKDKDQEQRCSDYTGKTSTLFYFIFFLLKLLFKI